MSKNKILVPVDLTPLSDHALEQAVIIAKKTGLDITILHVHDDKSTSAIEIDLKLKIHGRDIKDDHGISCDVMVAEGDIFEIIPSIANKDIYKLMVIGTHGIKGLKQKLFGANILKVVSKAGVPTLVIQKETELRDHFDKLVFPVGSHDSYQAQIDAAVFFAGYFDTEILIYSVERQGFEWPDQMVKNVDHAIETFKKKGIRFASVREEQNVYSVGYAKQTIKYAGSCNADLISIMSVPSQEFYYFAQSDKETMLTNEYRIPILCTSSRGQF